MGSLYSGRHMIYSILPETTFGTPIADAGAMVQLSCEPFTINPDVKHRVPNRAYGKLYHDIVNVWNDTKGSIPAVSVKTVALKKQLALWLYLCMQQMSEGITPNYEKVFSFPTVGPDFTANAGCFATLISKAPVASVSEKITSALCHQLTFTLNSKNDDANLALTAALIGMAYSRTSNPSGTLTKSAENRFNFYDVGVCTLDGNALILDDFKLVITSKLVPIGGASGKPQSFAIADQTAQLDVTGEWDANSRGALTKLDSGAIAEFILSWGTAATDGYLQFKINGVIQSGNPTEDETKKVKFVMDAIADVANTKVPVSITLDDAHQFSTYPTN
jgi:hypothetical protein